MITFKIVVGIAALMFTIGLTFGAMFTSVLFFTATHQ